MLSLQVPRFNAKWLLAGSICLSSSAMAQAPSVAPVTLITTQPSCSCRLINPGKQVGKEGRKLSFQVGMTPDTCRHHHKVDLEYVQFKTHLVDGKFEWDIPNPWDDHNIQLQLNLIGHGNTCDSLQGLVLHINRDVEPVNKIQAEYKLAAGDPAITLDGTAIFYDSDQEDKYTYNHSAWSHPEHFS